MFGDSRAVQFENNFQFKNKGFNLNYYLKFESARNERKSSNKLVLSYQNNLISTGLTLAAECDSVKCKVNCNPLSEVLLQASTELKDKSQIGIFLGQKFGNESKVNFGVGLKKSINENAYFKAKVDREMNVAMFTDYKIGNGMTIQSTASKNFGKEDSVNGFLGSDYKIGLKLKY